MRRSHFILTFGFAVTAAAALAQEQVDNAAVQARMDLMQTMRQATGTLGAMVKGETAFEPVAAEQAKTVLIESAGKIPELFEAEEMHPESEALPVIWEDWDGFVAAASEIQSATEALDTSSLEALRPTFAAVGKSCGGCHQTYRE